MLVAGLHVLQGFPELAWLMRVFGYGYLGVDLFFILSGYINAHVYFEEMKQPSGGCYFRYLWRRLIRIYPVHFVILALIASRHLIAGNAWTLPPDTLFLQLTLLHAWPAEIGLAWNVPSWSISAEWFAYLLFPALVPMVAQVRTSSVAFALAAATLVTMCVALSAGGTSLNSWSGAPALLRVLGEFSCGILLWRAVVLSRETIAGDVIGFGGTILFIAGIWLAVPWQAFPFFMAMIVLGAATATGIYRRILTLRGFVWLGMISYSIYMCHTWVFINVWRALDSYQLSPWLLIVAALLGAVVVGAAFFYLVENPVRQMLNRLDILAIMTWFRKRLA